MQMFVVKLFIRLCICKAESSMKGDRKAHCADKPKVTMLLYWVMAWMFIRWLQASHLPFLGLSEAI